MFVGQLRRVGPRASCGIPPLPSLFPQWIFWEDCACKSCVKHLILLAVPARLERATFGLGNRCSIRLSYGTKYLIQLHKALSLSFVNVAFATA